MIGVQQIYFNKFGWVKREAGGNPARTRRCDKGVLFLHSMKELNKAIILWNVSVTGG